MKTVSVTSDELNDLQKSTLNTKKALGQLHQSLKQVLDYYQEIDPALKEQFVQVSSYAKTVAMEHDKESNIARLLVKKF